ncbi:MAG: class I SAM-dependent methyltransferase [Mesorhizobium sp.]|nr:methyltransferase domain-containing protein [Mesorhizobium sp. M4B.F.Ca.ET.088.02.2.1]RWF28687.1 MAG: methyltransferase domain-containing protein [Mesorhizobium sp.]TJW03547.1 MAG: class I SAM-dependent methyltransferase [Mesorhizobium sp.]
MRLAAANLAYVLPRQNQPFAGRPHGGNGELMVSDTEHIAGVQDPTAQSQPLWKRARRRLYRFTFTKRKLSTKNLDRLCREYATAERTLVIHSEDVDYKPHFPNAFTVTKRPDKPADMHVDLYYRDLSKIASESYPVIVCTGLLEHIPDPERIVADMRRILEPGGRLVISASAVFSFHECPDNFFHFTPYGFKLLFKDWTRFDMLRGSSQPFETIGILIQRIHLQCDIFPLARPFIELLFHTIGVLDVFVVRQYETRQFLDERSRIDSMLPSNLQAVVVK